MEWGCFGFWIYFFLRIGMLYLWIIIRLVNFVWVLFSLGSVVLFLGGCCGGEEVREWGVCVDWREEVFLFFLWGVELRIGFYVLGSWWWECDGSEMWGYVDVGRFGGWWCCGSGKGGGFVLGEGKGVFVFLLGFLLCVSCFLVFFVLFLCIIWVLGLVVVFMCILF